MGNRQYVDERGEHWNYTLKTNGLNQYDTLQKTKHNIDVEGAIRGNNPTVTVNSVDSTISGEEFLAEDVTLNTGANSILASATDPSGTLSDSITINLDTSKVKTFTYDSNGSITGINWNGEQTTYGYDYENRLISITETNKPNIAYKYDYIGRRIEKNIGGTITKYVYDGDNIIAEYDDSNNLVARYVYGPSIDEPIRMEKLAGTPQICYYHFDALGSVTDLSNSSGQHIEHYVYSPFGKTKIYDPATGLKRDDSIVGNYYRFTARQWDPESSLYYYRARYYDANLGRFLQTDPVGYEGGSLNLYSYCGNNPLNSRDPFGKCDDRTIKELVNAFIRAMQKGNYEDASVAAFLMGKKLEQLQDLAYGIFKTIFKCEPLDITSWPFMDTNYGGITRSGPGEPKSPQDALFKIHDDTIHTTGTKWWSDKNAKAHLDLMKSSLELRGIYPEKMIFMPDPFVVYK